MSVFKLRVMMSICFVLVIDTWVSSICVPWLMAGCVLMVDEDSCVIVVRLLLKMMLMSFMMFLVCLSFTMD